MILDIEGFPKPDRLILYPDQVIRVNEQPPVHLGREPWVAVGAIAAAEGKYVPKQTLDTILAGIGLKPCTTEELDNLREALTPPVFGNRQSHPVIERGGSDKNPHYRTNTKIVRVQQPFKE